MAKLELNEGAVVAVACVCFALVVGTCNATIVAERWGAAGYQVRKACVYKTGNPDCKPVHGGKR